MAAGRAKGEPKTAAKGAKRVARKATPASSPEPPALQAAPSSPSGEARRPRQERGQRRVDAILDATAAIVAEDGIPAATMHAIARRSGTTIGSMYHFFPDRDAILVALAERHGLAIRAMAAGLVSVDWSQLSLEAAVDRYVETCIDYVRQNPDLLRVAHVAQAIRPEIRDGDASPEEQLRAVTTAIVTARSPDAPAAQRSARAATMLALVEGVVERSARRPSPPPAVMYRELKRALVAYLGAVDG